MTSTTPDLEVDRSRGPSTLLLVATLVLTSLNLRAAVTSVGPVLRDMQATLGMSDTVAGLLTSLPLLCFGAVGLLAARLGRRVGTDRALVASLVVITVGLVVRAYAPTTGWLLITSLVALVGMAVGNVLGPVVIKSWFPSDVGRYTGVYSVSIVIGTAVPVAVTVPIANAFGSWRIGLGAWAIPAALALVPWMILRRREPVTAPTPPIVTGGSPLPARIRRDPRAWGLMVFFAIQSIEAYVVMGWLPTILQDAGLTPSRAGWTASLALALAVVVAMIVPPVAGRYPDQRPWVVGLSATSVLAYLGLMVAPASAPLLWAILLGVGLGAFPLAILLIGLRTSTPRGTSELSGFVQGYGYLLAALGPLAIGLLHDLTGGWEVPLGALLLAIVPKLVAGLMACGRGVVDGDDGAHPAGSSPVG